MPEPTVMYDSNDYASTTIEEHSKTVQLALELSKMNFANEMKSNAPTWVAPNDSENDGEYGESKPSQNTTECVPVPSSEHVAEIVGRQGCKIKALRAKTNTYIKTPVRGEDPVFVVTGRKEDVHFAVAEINSAAEHFSQIRAQRKANGHGPPSPSLPGQVTAKVRVPYRVVGLVVGPKGATVKRIQQQTHTYIVTPSRDKEPIFEVSGMPENVQKAKEEIEQHIATRTGTPLGSDGSNDEDDFPPNRLDSGFESCGESFNRKSSLELSSPSPDNVLLNNNFPPLNSSNGHHAPFNMAPGTLPSNLTSSQPHYNHIGVADNGTTPNSVFFGSNFSTVSSSGLPAPPTLNNNSVWPTTTVNRTTTIAQPQCVSSSSVWPEEYLMRRSGSLGNATQYATGQYSVCRDGYSSLENSHGGIEMFGSQRLAGMPRRAGSDPLHAEISQIGHPQQLPFDTFCSIPTPTTIASELARSVANPLQVTNDHFYQQSQQQQQTSCGEFDGFSGFPCQEWIESVIQTPVTPHAPTVSLEDNVQTPPKMASLDSAENK